MDREIAPEFLPKLHKRLVLDRQQPVELRLDEASQAIIPGTAAGEQGLEQAGDDDGNPDNGNGEGQVNGDILQGNLLAAPESRGLSLAVLALGVLLQIVNEGMGVVLAEETHSGEGNQHEEVQSHQQVICNDSSCGQVGAIDFPGLGHSGQVGGTADVGAGHHGGDSSQILSRAAEVHIQALQQEEGQKAAYTGTYGTDEVNSQHMAGLSPNLLQVALQQQQGDGKGNHKVPNNVIIQCAGYGDDTDVGHEHSQQQGDDTAGNLGSPVILLLQIDCQSNGDEHAAQKTPGIVGLNQGMTQNGFKQHK